MLAHMTQLSADETQRVHALLEAWDLGTLRAEVEASLRKVSALVDEINRKWPFARDTKVKLP